MFAPFLPRSWDQAAWQEHRGWIPLQSGLAPDELRGEYRPAWSRGGMEPTPQGVEGQRVSGGWPGRALSSRERDLGALLPPEWSEHGQGPSHRGARVFLPQWQCCWPRPVCTFSEGTGPRASGFTRLPCPGPLRTEASVSHGGAPASGARLLLRGHPPLQALLWVGLWWVWPWGPALLEQL